MNCNTMVWREGNYWRWEIHNTDTDERYVDGGNYLTEGQASHGLDDALGTLEDDG